MISLYLENCNVEELNNKWIDLNNLSENLLEKIEYYKIRDYEFNFEEKIFTIEEDDDIEILWKINKELESIVEKDELLKLWYYIEYIVSSSDIANILEYIKNKDYEQVVYYNIENLKELARDFVDEGIFGNISDSIIKYIDYEKIANDLKIDGYDETEHGVFYCN